MRHFTNHVESGGTKGGYHGAEAKILPHKPRLLAFHGLMYLANVALWVMALGG
jgi:hypothetical protein